MSRRLGFLATLLMCLLVLRASAQRSQLPSLFPDDEADNSYAKNSVLKPGEDPQDKIHKLVFIKTNISQKSCYAGEPVLVTYQLYTAIACHSRVTKQVAFSNCSVIEMTPENEPDQIKKEGDKIYRIQLIRRVQLIPLQAGDLVIPPATVNNEVAFSTPGNPYLEKTYSADVSSEPYTVQVNALPEPQPDGFAGVTGRFSISAKVDSNTVAEDENNRLQITITGAGNIEAVSEPKVNWPKHTEHFDAQDSQHINRTNFPESGDKTFIIPFISRKKGTMTIPEISFSYFNTDLKKFETVTTKEIRLTITKAVKRTNPAAMVSDNVSNDKYLWFVPAIAAAAIAVWLLTNKSPKKKKPAVPVAAAPAEPQVITEPAPMRPDYETLLTALSEAEDNITFFTNAKTLLFSAVQFHVSAKQNDETILLNLLDVKDKSLGEEAQALTSVCNQNLYSPVENEATRANVAERLGALIHSLDKV